MCSKKGAPVLVSSKKGFNLLGGSTTLPINDCDKRFHSILKKTIIEDASKRMNFPDILELLVDILTDIGIGSSFSN